MSDDATGSDDGRRRSDRFEAGDAATGPDPSSGGAKPSTDATEGETTGDDEGHRAEVERLHEEIEALEAQLESFESSIEERTVHRDAIERDLRRYVRGRTRRGRARGWGPYLVLLYGTAMTLGAFFYLDDGLWAILAMLVIWTSTLGVFVLMVVIGAGVSLLDLPGRVRDAVGSWRS